MEDVVASIITFSVGLGVLIYILTFLSALAETVLGFGLIVPGSVIVLLAGVAASGGDINIWLLIICAALGALLGDNINYYLGKRYGPRWVYDGVWILKARHFEEGRNFFLAHGGKSIFFGRFIPVIKEIVPFVAGLFQMDKRRFMFYNALGAIGWSLEWVGLGYLFASYVQNAKKWIISIDIGFLIVFVGIVLYYLFSKKIMRMMLRK